MSGICWNGTDLNATYGFTLVGEGQMESGLLSLPALVRQETIIPGCVSPAVTIQRRSVRDVKLDCALFAADHATLLINRDAFVNLVGSGDYGAITVPDRTGLRLMAATVEALEMPRPDLGWITPYVRFTWTLRARIPYWEDASLQTANPVTSSLTNSGDEPCPVVWTCTATAGLSTGLWFEVGGQRFTDTVALLTNDVLTVETELPTVKKNGVANWSDVSTAAKFPWLAFGMNTVTKSSANFTLKADYRRWWR